MKKKYISRLLAGCLTVSMLAPSAALASVDSTAAIVQEQIATQTLEGKEAEAAQPQVRTLIAQNRWILSGNRWWYRHGDGTYTKNGWELINGRWYYFDESGWMKTGWITIDSGKYYLEPGSGAMRVGWLKQDGKWYYLNGSGAMCVGWVKLDGKWYYLNGSGVMMTGWVKVGSSWYYMDQDGVMAEDTWIGNYYVDKKGVWIPGKVKETDRWILSGNRWWYRHADGTYTKNGWELINGKWYYFDAAGWMKTGWITIASGTYYLEPGSGAMRVGWLKLDGKWYHLNGSGTMMTGWVKVGSSWYYMDKNGVMAADTWIGSYYVDASGAWVENKSLTYWVQVNGKSMYIQEDGTYVKKSWKTIDGKEYYFDKDGYMVTGWLELNGKWYYLKPEAKNSQETVGEKAYSYWVGSAGVGSYYIDNTGVMVANKTYTLNESIYTFDKSGCCTKVERVYLQVKDPNGKTYSVEKSYESDPKVSEEDLLTAAVFAEAGNQGMPGMTGVAMVMLNRTYQASYPSDLKIMLYQKTQFEITRNGALTKYIKESQNPDSHMLDKAREAVREAKRIRAAYDEDGTVIPIEGLEELIPKGHTIFDYLGFMTPYAFINVKLDPEATASFIYKNTQFYTHWQVKK